MDNRDHAARIIAEGLNNNDSPERITERLTEHNLLAENPPKPDRDMHDPQWQAEYQEEFDIPAPHVWRVNAQYSIAVFPGDDTVTVWDDYQPMEPFNLDEVKRLRLALHAAEQAAVNQAAI